MSERDTEREESATQTREAQQREQHQGHAEHAPPEHLDSVSAQLLDLQRTAGNRAVADAIVQRRQLSDGVTQATAGGGSALPGSVRSALEAHVGADLSGVKVHRGGEAARSTAALGAQAYTVGDDIVLGPGTADVSTPEGMHVLAHEATHVVQQRSGPVAGSTVEEGLEVSDPADSFEQAAERSAQEFSQRHSGQA